MKEIDLFVARLTSTERRYACHRAAPQLLMPDELFACSACGESRPAGQYSNTQKQKVDGVRKCSGCIASNQAEEAARQAAASVGDVVFEMQLSIKTLQGDSFVVEVAAAATIRDVKYQLALKRPGCVLHLYEAGKEEALPNDRAVGALGTATLFLVLAQNDLEEMHS